jgi:hypothetical protein
MIDSDPNFKPDFSQPFTRGNKDVQIDLGTMRSGLELAMRVAYLFKQGFTCFRFMFRYGARVFQENCALRPEVHNLEDAQEQAGEVWRHFNNMLRKVKAEAALN